MKCVRVPFYLCAVAAFLISGQAAADPPGSSSGSISSSTQTPVPVDWQKNAETLNLAGSPSQVKMAVLSTPTFDAHTIDTSTVRVSAGPNGEVTPTGFNFKTVSSSVVLLEFFVTEGDVADTLAPGTGSGEFVSVCAEGQTTGGSPVSWKGCDTDVETTF